MILDFFVKLKYQSRTIILSIGDKFSVRDLLCHVIYNAWSAKWRYASHTVNDVRAPSVISSIQQAVNFISKPSFRWKCM